MARGSTARLGGTVLGGKYLGSPSRAVLAGTTQGGACGDYRSRNASRAFSTRGRDPSLSLGITTTLFDWGRVRRTIESRGYLLDAADSAVQGQLESSAYDVTSNLIELGKQRIIVAASQRYVDRMIELVKMLEGIVAVDAGRVSELTQARVRLLQAEASRTQDHVTSRSVCAGWLVTARCLVCRAPNTGIYGCPSWPGCW